MPSGGSESRRVFPEIPLRARKPPNISQERPASAGSSFDAYVKARLQHDLGLGDFQTLFDHYYAAQVEPHNRDWAREEGAYIFDCYLRSPASIPAISCELKVSKEPPRFEFTVEAIINGVPFLGKPDARWVTPGLIKVIHDFKVNGYCSKSAVSPHKSYLLCRDGYVAAKQSKSHNTEHKEFLGRKHGNLLVNTSYLEAANTEWADQLSLYGWALGEKIGDEERRAVDPPDRRQADARRDGRSFAWPKYRATVKASYQLELAARLKRCWDAIASGHVFVDLSREDSDARCQILEDTAIGLQTDGSSLDSYFSEATREGYRG